MQFEFSTSRRVVFGMGVFRQLSNAPELDGVERVLLVRGDGGVAITEAKDMLDSREIRWTEFSVKGEPTISDIHSGLNIAREFQVERVIGLGGGSVIDTAKAIAGLSPNPGDIMDYLEVVGAGKPLQVPALGVIAIPTTAGTGSEVTRNAVIGVPDAAVKVSLRHYSMLPWLALVDPNLTLSMPPQVTASTGMDAMAQVLEPFVCIRANPITDAYCRTGLLQVGKALKAAYMDGSDQRAREKMSLVSLMGGLALANAGLGAVHGFAGPMGGRFKLPHGVLCARLLPAVVKVNVQALRLRDPHGQALQRYQEAAQLLMGNDRVDINDLVLWLEEYCLSLDIPRLSTLGISREGTNEIIGQAAAASSMKANPIRLMDEELAEILELCL